MSICYFTLFVPFILSALGIAFLVRYAPLLRLVDVPNGRSFHLRQTPKGAGIGFVLAVFASFMVADMALFLENYPIMVAILIVLATGVFDDVKEVSPRFKFVTILIAVVYLYYHDVAITSVGTYFGVNIDVSWFALPLTYFAVVGFTNALNLVDGIDGLAGSISIIIFATLFAVGVTFQDHFMITLSGFFISALLAFMLFNWNPAKIFMGDSGSLTLGFTIAVLCIRALEYVNPTVVLFIATLPILDTLVVMTRRIQRHQSPFRADKNHMHHSLFKLKRDVPFTVVMLSTIQFVFSMIGFRLIGQDDGLNVVLFGALFFIFLNMFDPRLRRRKKKKKHKKAQEPHSLHLAMREESGESA